ncbi:hypothetical protein G4B88_026106 [Cannabis sativa]|uniref:Uncharacterized protein n=1 Tax=Cannabis sativa TaxID=3483 RepID=A0A7J6DMU4_CANSA|nr:hypothetical protein G4B88_026106 [Cannabis sativa]
MQKVFDPDSVRGYFVASQLNGLLLLLLRMSSQSGGCKNHLPKEVLSFIWRDFHEILPSSVGHYKRKILVKLIVPTTEVRSMYVVRNSTGEVVAYLSKSLSVIQTEVIALMLPLTLPVRYFLHKENLLEISQKGNPFTYMYACCSVRRLDMDQGKTYEEVSRLIGEARARLIRYKRKWDI